MKELVGQGKPFYSAVDKAAGLLKRKVGTGAEFMQELKGLGGIKQSEIEDRGLGELMGAPKMTHEQFMQALAAKPAPAIREKVLGEEPEPPSREEIRRNANALIRARSREYASEGSDNSREYRTLQAEEMRRLRENHMDQAMRLVQEDFDKNPDPTYHHQYTLPGGDNYREMLIKAPAIDGEHNDLRNIMEAKYGPAGANSDFATNADKKLWKDSLNKTQSREQFQGVGAHFGGEKDILASMRLKDRTGPNGEKLLHLEELQSDWHQQGRDKGYKKTPEELQAERQLKQKAHDEYVKNESNTLNEEYKALKEKMRNTPNVGTATPDQLHQLGLKLLAKTHIANFESPQDVADIKELQNQYDQLKEANDLKQRESNILRQLNILSESSPSEPENRGVPNAPFKKNWEEMALKRLIHHAAEKGYHGIVVTPGAEQADRYSLSRHVDSLELQPSFSSDDQKQFRLKGHKEGIPIISKDVDLEELPQFIGKDLADKLLNSETGAMGIKRLSGVDLETDQRAKGMKSFYDTKVPNILNAIGKKHGVKTQLHAHPIPKGVSDFNPNTGETNPNQPQAQLHHFPITEEMRKDVLTNGLPLHREGGIIHKAVGGTVQPSINQMRAELVKKMPTSLADLSSIGANEAPSMNIKAYVPPSGGQLPVGGVSMGDQPLPIGGIDMNQGQGGQQLMPAGMAQPPQQGQPPQAGGMPSPLSAGASSPAQQPPSNILQMTPQGQALNAMTPPQPARMAVGGSVPAPYKIGGSDNMPPPDNGWKPDNGVSTFNIDNVQQAAKGGKVEVRPTIFDDAASRRNPKIEAAARALMEGEMKQKAYEKLVAKEKPVRPYDFVPMPATEEDALRAIGEKKMNKWKAHDTWPAGRRVGLRLDIPSYERHGVWMNTVHDEEGTGDNKLPTSHGPVSSVRNAVFEGSPEKAVRVATGEQNKNSFAKIMGELEHIDEENALKHMIKYLRHPEYRQVGYDPRRHGDFYDRETMEPITHAEHVVQIGPLVLAKKPKYGKRTLYAKGGDVGHYASKGKVKQTVKNAQRIAYPGIYGNPAEIAALAASRVAPEDPLLNQLFGVTRADMFQQAHGRKGMPHLGMLPGAAANPKGSMATEGVMNPRNEQRLIDVMTEAQKHQGLRHGMEPWYYMDPLFNRMVQLLGLQKATEEYKKMNALMGMASSSSEVNTEIPRGSLAYWLQNQGRFGEFEEHGGKRSKERPADFGETPGHLAHKTAHALPMRKFIERGEVSMNSPKVPMYIEASGVPATGFQTRTPVGDAHWSRAVGLADTRNPKTIKGQEVVPAASVSTPEMSALGPWWANKVASKLGLESVPAQALAWGAFSPQTGVTTPIGAPKLELIAKQIGHTAKRLGVSPQTARDLVLTGKERMGFKKGGKVKLSTNMDTINLELSRRSKKAK